MNKIIVLVFILVSCVLLAFWSPWRYININLGTLFGVIKPEDISGLTVYTLSGTLEVYIDGEKKGQVTSEKKFEIFDNILPGERLVNIKKASEVSGAYWEFNKVVEFEKGVNCVISLNLGPREEFSEGHLIYAVPKIDSGKPTQLNITFNVESPLIQIDSFQPVKVNLDKISVDLTLDKQHKISISKEGFETLEFSFLPDTAQEREKFTTYDINMDVYLMYIPLEVVDI